MLAAMEPTEHPAGFKREPPPSFEAVQAAFPQLTILELIGEGGMGCVFKARQPKLDRLVALKLLPAALAESDPAFAGRFEREGQLLARLHHPNIVAVHDSGTTGQFFYLIMEFVDGVNLRQAMRAQRFTAAQALAIVPRICDALQYAHDEGVLHRDIKPENILLDSKGRVKLADFGIAKLLAETEPPSANAQAAADAGLTHAGASLGTPSYMAPEQRESPGDVDHRADIYSLGVVFYELLTNELPRARFDPPSIKSDADPRVDAIVAQALEKERNRRQRNADEVKTQVESVVGAPAGAVSPKSTGKHSNPSPLSWLALAFVLAGILTPALCLALDRLNEGELVFSLLCFVLAMGFGWVTRHQRMGRLSAIVAVAVPLAAVTIMAVALFGDMSVGRRQALAQRQMAEAMQREAVAARAAEESRETESWSYQTRHLTMARIDSMAWNEGWWKAEDQGKPRQDGTIVSLKDQVAVSQNEQGSVTLTGPRKKVRRAATLLRLFDQPAVTDPLSQPLLNMPPEFFTRFAVSGILSGKGLNDSLFTEVLLETLRSEGVTLPQLASALGDHVLEIEKATFKITGTPFESIVQTPGASTAYDVTIPCADLYDKFGKPTKEITFTIERTTQEMGTRSKLASLAPWLIAEAKQHHLPEVEISK
jgi:serine/threonine protein kinase